MKSRMTTLLAILVLITIIVVSIVAGTYARYATTETGTFTASSAAWTFDAGIGASIDTTTVALVPTGTYNNLAPNTIAPGTSGTFDVYLDGTGSGTGIAYTISFAETAAAPTLPAGLTFTPATAGDGTLNAEDEITGTIAYSTTPDAMKKTVTVAWEWTLGDDAEDANYDALLATGANNGDAGISNYSVDVTIRGEQSIL